MCAECHSTQLQKQYDVKTDTFDTQYTDVDVACESCHGAGSQHLVWASDPAGFTGDASGKGLQVNLNKRAGVSWGTHPETGKPRRSNPRQTSQEIDTCARCHSRRGILSEDFIPGHPIGNTHRINLLEESLYHADGQPADETYVYGSFLQSRMYHEGVTCSDCHNPHSLALRLPGDQVCAQCHASNDYATPDHHFHPVSSEGARCASCHMPVTRFMGVDDRHDHSFRIPRPDISAEIGSPDACQACQACHTEQSHDWAALEIRKRYPNPLPGFLETALTIHQARLGNPESLKALVNLLNSQQQPVIFRATAATLLARFSSQKSVTALQAALKDKAPLVRRGAVEALAGVPPELRRPALLPRLEDPVRDVRLAAALALSTPDIGQKLSGPERSLLQQVLEDYLSVQALNADRAEAWFNRGVVQENRQFYPESEEAYRMALMRDPHFTPASIHPYNLLAGTGRDSEAGKLLDGQIDKQPEAASLHLVRGLMQVREKHYVKAGKSLETAVALDPDSSRARYILATLRFSQQQVDTGFHLLAENLIRHPYDYDSLYAMVSYAHQYRRKDLFLEYEPRLQAFSVLQ